MPPLVPTEAKLLARCQFPAPGTEVVAGVSGGADSLALMVLAVAAGLEVTAVHVDHGLRPGSADEADCVAAAASRFGAAFRAEQVEVAAGPNLEERARQARRAALGPGAMTGHTQDDQAETVLINLLRGAAVPGMGAMQPGSTKPILALRRFETVQLCADLGLEPVEDPSNEDRRFVRNRVRHEVLPLLTDIAQRDAVPLLSRTADSAREAAAFVAASAQHLDPTDSRALAAADPLLARTRLRDWLRDEVGHPPTKAMLDRAMAVVRHDVIACDLVDGRRLERTGGRLRVVGGE